MPAIPKAAVLSAPVAANKFLTVFTFATSAQLVPLKVSTLTVPPPGD